MSSYPDLGILARFLSITLATIGIVNSLVLSRYNDRMLERRSLLSRYISSLENRLERFHQLFVEEAMGILRNERNNTKTLSPTGYENFSGIPSFLLFLLSFLISYLGVYFES